MIKEFIGILFLLFLIALLLYTRKETFISLDLYPKNIEPTNTGVNHSIWGPLYEPHMNNLTYSYAQMSRLPWALPPQNNLPQYYEVQRIYPNKTDCPAIPYEINKLE
jgi:hypothetical protein